MTRLRLGPLAILTLLAPQALAQKTLTYAVVPLCPLLEAPQSMADFATRKLQAKLKDKGARLVDGAAVTKALAGQGSCQKDCMVALGRATKADRVLAGTVRLQSKKRGPGQVWELDVLQVDVVKGEEYGTFKRVCTCGYGEQTYLIGQLVQRAIDHTKDGRKLVMSNPVPMRAPDDAPQEAGMVYVPAGEFVMGSDKGQPDEEPRHVVYTDAFFIDRHEVTNEEYDRCVAARRCRASTTRHRKDMNAPRQPVAGVGFQDAQTYCAFAGKRLLTEAEWEKAARGSDERMYPWGNEWHDDWANMAWDKDGYATSAPVGSFPQNVSPYGAYDMAGNVWEWTADYHSHVYYRHSPPRNPQGPKGGDKEGRRVMRGGSWMYSVPFFLVTPNRSPGRPLIRKMWVGMRCGKDAPR